MHIHFFTSTCHYIRHKETHLQNLLCMLGATRAARELVQLNMIVYVDVYV